MYPIVTDGITKGNNMADNATTSALVANVQPSGNTSSSSIALTPAEAANQSFSSQIPQEATPQVEALQEAAVSGSPKEQVAAKKMLRQLKLKVDGSEVIEQLPFEIEDKPEIVDYMTKQLQMSKASNKRFQDSKALEEEVKQFVGALKGDTRATLQKLGIDPKEFAAAVLEDEIKKSQMSPEQREKLELEQKLKSIEEERIQERNHYLQQEQMRLQEMEYQKIDTDMTNAIEKSDLPKSGYVVKKMAEYMAMGLQAGYDLTAEDILPLVRSDIISDIQHMIKSMPQEAVENIIGKDIFTSVRKKNLAKAKTQTPGATKSSIKDVGNSNKVESKSSKDKKNMRDFFGF